LERENLKLKKTPFQIVKEKCAIYDPGIVNFQPFILDEVRTYWIPHYQKQSVPYVADEIKRSVKILYEKMIELREDVNLIMLKNLYDLLFNGLAVSKFIKNIIKANTY
jgi:hypothetical protein